MNQLIKFFDGLFAINSDRKTPTPFNFPVGKHIQNCVLKYFDQHLGSAHSKCLSKSVFSTFFGTKKLKKEEKAKTLRHTLAKQCIF